MAARFDVGATEHRRGGRQEEPHRPPNRYTIARGEAMECGAILDVVALLHVVPEPELENAKQRSGAPLRCLARCAGERGRGRLIENEHEHVHVDE